MTVVDVRGSLGTQVLSLMGHCALALERHQWPSKIRLNVKGVMPESRVDYLSQIFFRCPPVVQEDSTRKLHPSSHLVKLMVEHREEILSRLGLEPAIPNYYSVLHVRVGDRDPTSEVTYRKWIWRHPEAWVIGNDFEFNRSLSPQSSIRMPETDWNLLRGAPRITGPVSTFTLSALLCGRPDSVLEILPQDGPIRVGKAAMAVLEDVMEWCPRIRWAEL